MTTDNEEAFATALWQYRRRARRGRNGGGKGRGPRQWRQPPGGGGSGRALQAAAALAPAAEVEAKKPAVKGQRKGGGSGRALQAAGRDGEPCAIAACLRLHVSGGHLPHLAGQARTSPLHWGQHAAADAAAAAAADAAAAPAADAAAAAIAAFVADQERANYFAWIASGFD